jgi:hypothetical protein
LAFQFLYLNFYFKCQYVFHLCYKKSYSI